MNMLTQLNLYVKKSLVVKNGLYGFFEVVILTALMLVATPFLLARMGAENYGIWTLAMAFWGFMGVFEFGLGSATTKFIAEYREKDDIREISSILITSFGLAVVFSLFSSGILYYFSSYLSHAFPSETVSFSVMENIFRLIAFGLPPAIIENVALAVPKGFQNYRDTTVLSVTKNVAILLVAILIAAFKGSTYQIVQGTIIVLWMYAILGLYLVRRTLRFTTGICLFFSILTFRRILNFILFMGLMGVGVRIFNMVDRIAVVRVLGFSAGAYYAIAIGVANKFSALGSTITQSLVPAFSSWNVNDSAKTIESKLWKITFAMALIIIAITLLFFAIGKPLLVLWLGYDTAMAVLPAMRILVFIYALRTISTPAFQAVNGMGFPHVTASTALLSGVGTIILIFYWGKLYGLVGAAWANAASLMTVFTFFFILYQLRKKSRM
jgi:O-antigen/teichoic acid export membrane protein